MIRIFDGSTFSQCAGPRMNWKEYKNMEAIETNLLSRKRIAVRLLYTIFFLVTFEILKVIVQLAVLFQYVYLFITRAYNEPVRRFSNKVSTFAYRLLRYVTLNENACPYPFSDFPKEMEAPEPEVSFD
jgi:hypothetical protein